MPAFSERVNGLLLAVETTYKTAVVPAAADDGIQLEELIWGTIEVDYLEENLRGNQAQGGMGRSASSPPGGRFGHVTVTVALKGAGAVYSATVLPEADLLLRIAGLERTDDFTGGTENLIYEPRSSGFESATAYVYAGGWEIRMTGVRAQLTSLTLIPNQIPLATFELWGVIPLATDPTEVAVPAIVYSGAAVNPQVIRNVGLTLNAFDPADFQSFELDMRTALSALPRGNDLDGHAGYEIVDWDPKLDVSIDPPALASLNPFTLREAATTFGWDIGPIGLVQYNAITISGPAGRIMGNPFSATDSLAMVDLEIRCQNTSVSALDDAFQILFD